MEDSSLEELEDSLDSVDDSMLLEDVLDSLEDSLDSILDSVEVSSLEVVSLDDVTESVFVVTTLVVVTSSLELDLELYLVKEHEERNDAPNIRVSLVFFFILQSLLF